MHVYFSSENRRYVRFLYQYKCGPVFLIISFVFPVYRFCDLVFQGPLSVQEDWVKHLQRHIMNTAVPHTGAAMVEVTCFPKDTNTHMHPPTSP